MMKNLLLVLIFLPYFVFGEDISGTGWFFQENDGDKRITLFEKDGTFTYLQLVNWSGNEGEVYSDDDDTYSVDGDRVVKSYNNGYRICSLTINSKKDRMSGTCINKTGNIVQTTGKLID